MADILHALFFVVVAGAAFLTLIALTLSNLPPLLALVRVNLDNSVTISNASGRPHGKTQGGQTGFDDARR